MESEFNKEEHLSDLQKRENVLNEEIEELKILNDKKAFQSRALKFSGIGIFIVLFLILITSLLE